MIQRKMGNKPPLKPAAQGWPAGLGWPEEAPRAQQSYTFRLQFAKLASELKARSQIAVGARYAQRQHLDGRKGRVEIQIDQGNIYFGAFVAVLAEGRAAVSVPEALLRFILAAVTQRIEGLVALWLLEIGGCRSDAVDRVDFGARLAVLIRDDPVFRFCLGNANGLGNALEQIHDRRTAELKSLDIDTLFQSDEPVPLLRFLQRDQDLERAAEIGLSQAIQSGQVKEEEFLREREVF